MEKKIIQLLLYEGGPLKKEELAKSLETDKDQIDSSLPEVRNLLAVLDLRLVHTQTTLEIALSEDINSIISKTKLEEMKTDLSESALQVLAVVMYKGKATAAEINFVRGVDSGRSIKNLLTRGLIERQEEKNRKYYLPTTETLRYLNLETVENLQDFIEISGKLKVLIEGE